MPLHPKQVEIFKNMPGPEKLAIAGQLFREAFEIKKTALSHQHPDWSKNRIQQATKELFAYGTIRNI